MSIAAALIVLGIAVKALFADGSQKTAAVILPTRRQIGPWPTPSSPMGMDWEVARGKYNLHNKCSQCFQNA